MNWGRLIAVFLLGLAGCQTPQRELFTTAIRKEYQPSTPAHRLELKTVGQPLALPADCVIDIESGNGHGHYLRFMRFTLHGRHVTVEDAIYGPRWIRPSGAKLQRLATDCEVVRQLLDWVRLLPIIQIAEQEANRPPPRIISQITNPDGSVTIEREPSIRHGAWRSSNDFFVLVRVLDGRGTVLFEDEFAGYAGGDKQSRYLDLKCVTQFVDAWAKKQTSWTNVTGAAMRSGHFADAFRLNQNIMREDFHWWVLEDSVEALGFFGNPTALPVLKEIRATQTNLNQRQTGKIDEVIAHSDYWLAGEPQDLLATEKPSK